MSRFIAEVSGFSAPVTKPDSTGPMLGGEEGIGVHDLGDRMLILLRHADGTTLFAELDDRHLDILGHAMGEIVERWNAAAYPSRAVQ